MSAAFRSPALVFAPLLAATTVAAADAPAHAIAATDDPIAAATAHDPTGATADDPETHAEESMRGFGAAVAIGEDAIFIGEPSNLFRPGRVYVYRRADDGRWIEAGRLTAEDAARNDGFGSALAVDGDVLFVASEERGAVYLFRRDDDGEWEQATRLTAADAAEGDGFGASIALDGGTLLVGAPGQAEDRGAVYVYQGEGDDWSAAGKLVPSDSASGTEFGAALALEDGRALIGAPDAAERAGRVYVYARDGGSWSEVGTLPARGLHRGAGFGSSVAFSNGRALAGVPNWLGLGAVLVFEPDQGEWEQVGRLLAFDGGQGDEFGAAIEPTANALWIGAEGEDGVAYIFERGAEPGDFTGVSKLALETSGFSGSPLAVGGGVAVFGLTGADQGAGKAAIYNLDATGEWTLASTLLSEAESLDPIVGGRIECGQDGQAALFPCGGVDLLSFLPITALGGDRGTNMSDMWGWTDPETGTEYVLAGRTDGTAFVDISNPLNPVFVGTLPLTDGANPASWRDIKVYENHAYIVADGAGQHGMQVFDLTRLRNYDGEPITFEPDLTYDNVASVHNIVINKATGFAYAVGAGGGGTTCGGGLHMINIQEPENPEFAGCFADERTGRANTGYTHDAQCVIYEGPDEQYQGREICFGFNETALSIADVTDKENPEPISIASYPNAAYTHQGWLTEDQSYLLMNDEGDESNGSVQRTRTLIWDVRDLDDPQLIGTYMGETGAIDHNLYIKDGLAYESNYTSGLRVIDISDIRNPFETAYFDVAPYHSNAEPSFAGTWSNYPFFESGVISVNSSEYGLFLLRLAEPPPTSDE